MMKSVVIILLFCSNLCIARNQTDSLHYTVELSSINVGKMVAIRHYEGKNATYTLISDVNIDLLFFKLKLNYIVKSHYVNEVLQHTTVDTKTSKGAFHTEINMENDLYIIKAHQYRHDLERTQTKLITYSVAKAFFNEPAGQYEVFGEYLGDYLRIVQKSKRIFVFKRPKQRDKYTYKNGYVNKVEKKFKLLNYVIRRND